MKEEDEGGGEETKQDREREKDGGREKEVPEDEQREREGWIKQHTESEIFHCNVRDDNRLTSALSSPRFQQLVGNAINIRNYATSPPTLHF